VFSVHLFFYINWFIQEGGIPARVCHGLVYVEQGGSAIDGQVFKEKQVTHTHDKNTPTRDTDEDTYTNTRTRNEQQRNDLFLVNLFLVCILLERCPVHLSDSTLEFRIIKPTTL